MRLNFKYFFILGTFSLTILVLIFIFQTSKYSSSKKDFSKKVTNDNDDDDNLIIPLFSGSNDVINIAIGCAITSHGHRHHLNHQDLTIHNVRSKLPLLKSLVPSFCKTASSSYRYHFYASYDVRDPCFAKNTYMSAIHNAFKSIVEEICPTNLDVSLYFVKCNHNKNPAWAQNDAMMEAYLDHVDYYYRVNDDTRMLTPGWTEAYIEILQSFDPPNIGVVGPLHKGGNEDILTYDFVHRTHIDIFGSYYPRVFTDWWADNWISLVYGSERTMKLPNVRLLHTSEQGTRYSIRNDREKFLNTSIERGKATISRYLKSIEESSQLIKTANKSNKIISMSLWGSKTRYTYGALRNAQLLPVYFPKWKLRIYVEKPKFNNDTSFPPVSNRIITKLKLLGVDIKEVDHENLLVPPMMWRYLVVDDEDVDVFIVRDADCRFSDRDARVVNDWLKNCRSAIHCIRDHPNHKRYPMLGGLWGGIPRRIKQIHAKPWKELMHGLRSDYNQDAEFLENVIWPTFQNSSCCHDSVSCLKWSHSKAFPLQRDGTEHLGQVFDAFENVKEDDVQILLNARVERNCSADYREITNYK